MKRGWSYKPGASIIRGFDSLALLREDGEDRINWLADKIAEAQSKIEKAKREVFEGEQRITRVKKDLGIVERAQKQTESGAYLSSTGQGLLEPVKVKLTWHAFSEIRDKYPNRVQNDMNAGLVVFTDGSVTLYVPTIALGRTAHTTLH